MCVCMCTLPVCLWPYGFAEGYQSYKRLHDKISYIKWALPVEVLANMKHVHQFRFLSTLREILTKNVFVFAVRLPCWPRFRFTSRRWNHCSCFQGRGKCNVSILKIYLHFNFHISKEVERPLCELLWSFGHFFHLVFFPKIDFIKICYLGSNQ